MKGLGVFEGTKHGGYNHVLINEYRAGEGIMPHEDGPAYEPVVATISLGGSIVLDVYEKKSEENSEDRDEDDGPAVGGDVHGRNEFRWRILQEPGSLLVTKGEAYRTLLHGISSITSDENLGPETIANWALLGDAEPFLGGVNERTTRVSLTFRDVTRTTKGLFR